MDFFSTIRLQGALQKHIVSIMADAQPRTSCGRLFKRLEILPVPC